jgi:MFS family permease
MSALVSALRRHSWLRQLGYAFILSSLGNGLTQVVVFGQLLQWRAAAATLVFAYVLATLPGFLGSLLGERLCQRYSPFVVLLLAEALGLLSLAFPLYSLLAQNSAGLLAVQACSAVISGFTFPALSLVFKRGLSSEELPAATCMETLIFAAQVLLGVGVGVLIFPLINAGGMLLLDALSFAASAILLLLAARRFVPTADETQPDAAASVTGRMCWRDLSPLQRRSLLMLPMLATVGTPAMSLLPALAQQIKPDETTGFALPLLFARSLGQLCGPLLLPASRMRQYAGNNRLLAACLLIFLGSYLLIPQISGLPFAPLGMIFIAHIASNLVFALATFGILREFDAQNVASASATAWRWQLVAAGVASLMVATLTQYGGAIMALEVMSGVALTVAVGILWRYRR